MEASDIKKVAVIGGGGLMGHGIALACLMRSNVKVSIMSRRQETLDHGILLIKDGPFGITKAIAKNKITQVQGEEMLSRLTADLTYEKAVSDAEIIFESVPEKIDVKIECFKNIEKYARDSAFIASGTSAFMISELAGGLKKKNRLVGTHWMYPSNIMPLVEMAKSEITSEETVKIVVDYLKLIGKRPVVVKDMPGFFITRFVNSYLAEGMRLFDEGIATMSQIDEMVKTGLGWPMGVFEFLDDTASFEAWYHAQEYLFETLGDRYPVPAVARKLYKARYLGSPLLKTNSEGGWYDFFGETRPPKKTK